MPLIVLKDDVSRADAGEDTLKISLATQALGQSASERYQGQVFRHRFNKMYYEAGNMGTELRKEEISRGFDRYICEVKTLEGRTLRSTDVSAALQELGYQGAWFLRRNFSLLIG